MCVYLCFNFEKQKHAVCVAFIHSRNRLYLKESGHANYLNPTDVYPGINFLGKHTAVSLSLIASLLSWTHFSKTHMIGDHSNGALSRAALVCSVRKLPRICSYSKPSDWLQRLIQSL